MPCTKSTPKCPCRNGVPECCSAHIQETIVYTCNLFDELNIRYWIDYNTLAGFAQQIFIPQRNVICYFNEDYDKVAALNVRIHLDGYYLSINKNRNTVWFNMAYSFANRNVVCLLDCRTVQDKIIYNPVFPELKSTLLKNILPLKKMPYLDYDISVPANYEAILKER